MSDRRGEVLSELGWWEPDQALLERSRLVGQSRLMHPVSLHGDRGLAWPDPYLLGPSEGPVK